MGEKVSGRKRRQGKAFEREWWTGMQVFKRKAGGRVRIHRHYDLSDYVGKFCPTCKQRLDVCGNCHTPLPSSKAQPPRQPSDYEAVWQGIDVLMELKSSRNPASFEMRYIKDHQMMSALNNIQAGGEGVFCLQDRSSPRNIKVYCIQANALLGLSHRIGKNCIRWSEIAACSFSTPARLMTQDSERRAPYYDFEQFLTDLLSRRKGIEVKVKDPEAFMREWGSLTAQLKDDIHTMPKGVSGFLTE